MALDFTRLASGMEGLEAIIDNPNALELVRNTINLRVGQETPFKGMIGKEKVNAYATLNSAKLTRLSLLRQGYAEGSTKTGDYYIVTGQFNPVSIDITIDNGGQKIPLHDVWRQMTAALKGGTADETMTAEAWLAALTRMGLNYTNGSFQLYFQHMGAKDSEIERLFNDFIDMGAGVDVATLQKNSADPSRPQRMENALVHPSGVPVSFFELSSVNRDKVASKQGFVDLCDALTEQLNTVTKLRSDASILETKADEDESLSDAQRKSAVTKAGELRTRSNQFLTSFSGRQLKTRRNKVTGELEWMDDFAPSQAPCGRFDLVIDGETRRYDLWQDRQTVSVSTEAVPSLKDSDDPLED
jgi:hypothetical protein